MNVTVKIAEDNLVFSIVQDTPERVSYKGCLPLFNVIFGSFLQGTGLAFGMGTWKTLLSTSPFISAMAFLVAAWIFHAIPQSSLHSFSDRPWSFGWQ